ncbi:MAG TPA: TadE/TadG family type IV pilus assembly protein [candidate division Zixibacteria bacterium]|nr:TadE/TadG family type IV pilus assembly protein [candidate division Zixibacteria bacterium]
MTMTVRSHLRRPRERPRGQSLVEFALILPILLILLLGIFDFGRAVAAHNSVSNAARSAVRVAIVDQNPDVVRAAAEREAVGLVPLNVDFNPNVTGDNPCRETICRVSVRVSYRYVPATPIFGNLVGTITISSISELPIERLYSSPSPPPTP